MTKKNADLRRTDGARELKTHLQRIKQSVPDFCQEQRLDRIQVQRVMTGERWRRVTVDFALSIQVATKGRVKWTSFLSSTATTTPAKPARAA